MLRGVSLTVAAGDMVAVVGASGAGKSTFLHVLGTLDAPSQGQMLIDGVEVTSMSAAALAAFRNRTIGFVFQFHHLLPEFTALENASMPGLIAGLPRAEATKRATELLKRVHLGHRLQHRPGELSGGEQQRVAVARALINNPSVIFADEPSGNLDSANKQELHKLFFQLRDQFGVTIVVVTHDGELANSSDVVFTMVDGTITNAQQK